MGSNEAMLQLRGELGKHFCFAGILFLTASGNAKVSADEMEQINL